MEKKKTKLLPAIIKHRATIEGWLELMDKNTGLFARKGYKSILKENNYLTIFKLCASAASLKYNAS